MARDHSGLRDRWSRGVTHDENCDSATWARRWIREITQETSIAVCTGRQLVDYDCSSHEKKILFWGEQMDRPAYFRERRECARYPIRLPLEYWQPDDVCRGTMIENLGEGGLLIRSHRVMPVGKELRVTIFFPNEYKFDGITAVGKITWKGICSETDWMGYRYGLEFVRISRKDSEKLSRLLGRPSISEAIPIDQDSEPRSFPREKFRSPPKAVSGLPQVKVRRPRGLQEG